MVAASGPGGATIAAPPERKTKQGATEFAESYLAYLRDAHISGTFLVSYHRGRLILIRRVTDLA